MGLLKGLRVEVRGGLGGEMKGRAEEEEEGREGLRAPGGYFKEGKIWSSAHRSYEDEKRGREEEN